MSKNLKIGDKITFRRSDGALRADTIRTLFTQQVLLMPYAPNQLRPAAVLTEHSWCFVDDIVVSPETKWVTFCKRTNDPKLHYLEQMLAARGIPSRRNGESWHAPILEVPTEFESDAWDMLGEELTPGDGRLDDMPDDHPAFASRY